jgi:ferredoxin
VFLVGANAERWCPLGGVEALYGYLHEGNMLCSLGVSNFYILGGVLLATLLLRRAFCGWVCPIGAVSEWIQAGARRLGIRPARVPYRLDRGLALLKYVVLAAILWFTYRTGELMFRGYDPCYALIGRHGEDITLWAYVISGAIVLGSVVVLVPFCRWLCPLAAVFHPFSRIGLARIKIDHDRCVSCGKCSRHCPMGIPLDRSEQVTAARCTSCFECIEVCPLEERGAIGWGPPGPPSRRWPAWSLVVLLLGILAAAVSASYAFPLPSFVYVRDGIEAPPDRANLEMEVRGLKCRGSANLFVYFLERDDLERVPGYLRVDAWPAPAEGRARITYDPASTDEAAIRRAITSPFYDAAEDRFRMPPFEIVGHDPLGDLDDLLGDGLPESALPGER